MFMELVIAARGNLQLWLLMQTGLCLKCVCQRGNTDSVLTYTFIYKSYKKVIIQPLSVHLVKKLGATLFLFFKHWLVEEVIIWIANLNYMDLVSAGNEDQQI